MLAPLTIGSQTHKNFFAAYSLILTRRTMSVRYLADA